MNNVLKLEEVGMFAFSIYLFRQTDFAWWWFIALILVPDIGMLGYVINSKVGSVTYNIFHHKGLALAILVLGHVTGSDAVILAGIILFGHTSLDRIFGYGLKYPDHFKHTHLGWIQ